MDICNVTCDTKKDTIVYTSLPAINDLRCAICEIDFIEVHDSSSKSNFHWKTMKCRLLIHLVSDVIASPVSGTETLIFVITNKKFLDTGKLERILRNFKLVYRGLRPVNNIVYKSCLIYTIQTKIAPLWNKVGEYFVQGKEFYNFIEGARALQLDILTEDMNTCLKLRAERIKISYIKLEDYLPSSVISQFLADPKGYINLSLYNFPFIYVLPSTKKGKLLSVSKEIPSKYPFKDYDQLRRHWKNMYGYSLPKNKDGILYYEIKFLMPKSNIFIYPSLCIISGPVDVISNRDKEPTITQFLSDMLIQLPVVCNKQLKISKDTPFNTKLGNTTSLVDTLLKNTELNVHSPKNNITSSAQLEFSAKYVDELTKNANKVSTSLKTHLAMIHQLHNTPFGENTNTNLNIENTEEHQNVMPAKKKLCIENTVAKETNDNFTLSKETTISKYFPIQKPYSSNNTAEQEKQKQLSLKEKLLKAKSDEPGEIQKSVLQIDEKINIEAMAKNNQLQLHQLHNNVLSNWLQQHSIPHKSKEKKTELINKILSHIKNTQVLHQFRM